MLTEKERTQLVNQYYDVEASQFMNIMCKTCKFYDNRCTKNRIVRKCARKGLKNKE